MNGLTHELERRSLLSVSSSNLDVAVQELPQGIDVAGTFYFAGPSTATDARRSSEQATSSYSAQTFDARKVTVDPLGRIRWAND